MMRTKRRFSALLFAFIVVVLGAGAAILTGLSEPYVPLEGCRAETGQ